MLGSALPATATLQTSTPNATPSSPTRPSRLRGLSYLRNYTHSHLHSSGSRENTPSLPRSRSNNTITTPNGRSEDTGRRGTSQAEVADGIENSWSAILPNRSAEGGAVTDQAAATESKSPERNTGMNRTRASSAALGATPTDIPESSMRRPSRNQGLSTMEGAGVSGVHTPSSQPVAEGSGAPSEMPSIKFMPHTDRSHQRPSLQFPAVTRTLATPNSVVRVGRYSERDTNHSSHWPDGVNGVAPVGFKSKVVSRKHCEFWQSNGQWYVKDSKSSSGTFLNHVRLSGPGQESRPYPVSDGDLVQLGIDFKGGEEVIFRCVKIRIEINRGWQKNLNAFNTSEYKKIVNRNKPKKKGRDSDAASTNSSECSICLNPVAPCQALFVAPCSHVWHFKCIRNLLNGSNFLCPNCRLNADLDADVEPPEDYEEAEFEEDAQDDDAAEGVAGEEEDDRGESGGVGLSSASDDALSPRSRHRDITADEGPSELPQSRQSAPRDIPLRAESSSLSDPLGGRATTPTSNTQFALAAGVINMNDQDDGLSDGDPFTRHENIGPMTPRNDAGPFVLDGVMEGAQDASRSLQRGLGHGFEDE